MRAIAGFVAIGALLAAFPLYVPVERAEIHPHWGPPLALVGSVCLAVAAVLLGSRQGWNRLATLAAVVVALGIGARTAAHGDRRGTGGQVEGPEGEPLAGVLVLLDDGGPRLRTARTDQAGRFRFALDPRRHAEARLLVCPAGAIPWVAEKVPGAFTLSVYGSTPRPGHPWPVRAFGWRAAVPEECGPVERPGAGRGGRTAQGPVK